MVGQNNNFISFFVGGNGTSKTATQVNILANICYGRQDFYPVICPKGEKYDPEKHNWMQEWGKPPKSWFDYPLYNNFPYIKQIRIVSDPETVKAKIVPEIKKWFPKNEYTILPEAEYETKKEGKAFESKITTKTGFEITLMTNEQDVTQFESAECGLIVFDEPPRKDIFMACVARTRRGGRMMGGFTPLFHSGWLKDEYIDKAEPGFCDYIEADVMDNCVEEKGARGILYKSDIDNMARAYPEDEKEARLHGKFGHLLGLVFKRFNRKIHVIEPFSINQDDYVVTMALDTHPRVPDKATWMATDKSGRKIIIAELSIKGTTKKLAEAIKAVESPTRLNSWRIYERLIEPASEIADKHEEDDRPLHDRLDQDHDLFFEVASKKRDLARRLIADALEYRIEANEMIEKPILYIFNTCREVIHEFENYVWDEYKGRTADERGPKQKPKDNNDHHLENIGRLLINDYTYSEPPVKDENRFQKHRRELVEEITNEPFDETKFL